MLDALAPVTTLDAAMDAFAAGDAGAFTTVDALGRPALLRVLRRLTRDAAAAADLAQDTLIRVVRSRHRWRPGARFLPWAHAIARRLFLDQIRGRRSEQRACDTLAHRAAHQAWSPPEQALAARRAVERIVRDLDRLPAAQRDAIERVALAGETVDEAAHRLGCSPVVVRVRLFRARRSLAAALALH